MEYKRMVQTFDGELHSCVRDAEHHLKKLESNLMSKISHGFHCKKFTEIAEWVDENLNCFTQLSIIRKDMKEFPTHDDSED